ncbi:glycosyltransferase [Nocardioides lijunqiniae]|uniref:glycosyltransferase n=1 Tax=Nocardioides lijunqiniae TaxID=2760832 RepID=UPI001D0CA701
MPHAGSFVASRVRALRAANVQVDLIGLDLISRVAGQDEITNEVQWKGLEASWGRATRLVAKMRPDAFRARSVSRDVLKMTTGGYDAVVAHGMFTPPAGLVGRHVANELGVPLIVQLHGSDVNVAMARFPKLHSSVLNGADGVIFVSQPLLARARELGFSSARSAVVPNGVDSGLFRFEGARSTVKHVAFVGNLEYVKGADRLPRIFRGLRNFDPGVRLTVIGSGSLKKRISEEFRASGLSDVNLMGTLPHAEVAEVLRTTDVLVMPSRSEGWPCVVLEAHASGCLVIATDVGGTAEALGSRQYVVSSDRPVEDAIVSKTISALRAEGAGAVQRRTRAEAFDWTATVGRELEHINAWTRDGGP